MKQVFCAHPDFYRSLSITEFENLQSDKINEYRRSLFCLKCGATSYFRRETSDGKSACFGSLHHASDCLELSKRYIREKPEIEFLRRAIKNNGSVILPLGGKNKLFSNQIENVDKDSGVFCEKVGCAYFCSPEDMLSLLISSCDIHLSNSVFLLGSGFSWRAKNLFVNVRDAQPSEKPKVFWGVISHVNRTQQWINVSGREDVGVLLAPYKGGLLKRYGMEDFHLCVNMHILVFGKCFLNKSKDRLIIKPWDNNESNIYLV